MIKIFLYGIVLALVVYGSRKLLIRLIDWADPVNPWQKRHVESEHNQNWRS